MLLRPPISTRTYTLVPYTTLFRSIRAPICAPRVVTVPRAASTAAPFVDAEFVRVGLAKAVDMGHLSWGVRSEEQTFELQSIMRIAYAGYCLKKKKKREKNTKDTDRESMNEQQQDCTIQDTRP